MVLFSDICHDDITCSLKFTSVFTVSSKLNDVFEISRKHYVRSTTPSEEDLLGDYLRTGSDVFGGIVSIIYTETYL